MTTAPFFPGIEVQEFYSKVLNRELRLYVKLPWRYAESDTTYPVLFALDANRSFPLYSTTSLIYETPGPHTKEIVIAGVGYKVDDDRVRGLVQWAAWRTRDFTPVRREKVEQNWRQRLSPLIGGADPGVATGGAGAFLEALQREIIPFVEATYRVSAVDRGLAGYSDGGLFALFALFHAPELFTRYFAGSPSLWDVLFEDEEDYAAAHDDLRARLFLTAGGREPALLERMGRMVDCLRARRYPGLQLFTHVFEDAGHSSAYAAAVSRALGVLYDESWLAG